MIARTVQEYGRIDTLVNNAGISMWAKFAEVTDPAVFDQIMQVNYMGSVYCTFYALPHLKQTRGRIVGVSSVAGKNGVPTRSGYAASKHAMVGFFDTLRIELAEDGISTAPRRDEYTQIEPIVAAGQTLYVAKLNVDYTQGPYPILLLIGQTGGILYLLIYAYLAWHTRQRMPVRPNIQSLAISDLVSAGAQL